MNYEQPEVSSRRSPEQGGTSAEELAYRLRQQELLARFGGLALETPDFTTLLQEATRLCAEGLHTRFCKAMEYLADDDQFLVRAGVGWKPEVIGSRTGADLESPTGYAFQRCEPVISSHLESEGRFRTPQALVEHGIRRAINVPIITTSRRYGVLEVDSTHESRFTEVDIAFMQGFANLLGVALERGWGEVALRRSEEHLRGAFAIRTVGVMFWGKGCGLTEVNDAFLHMTGFSREEAIGKTWQELTPEEFYPESMQAVEQVTSLGEATPYEKQYLRKDASRWWGLFAPRKVGNEVVEFVLDITARREAEERLRASEARLTVIFAQASVGLSEVEPGGRFLHVNDELCRILGRSRKDVLGRSVTDVTYPDDISPSLTAVARAVETGEPASLDKRYVRPDGAVVWANSSITRLSRTRGQPGNLLVVTIDLTARRRAEAALRESEARFRHMADSAPALIWMSDEEGQVTFANMHYEYMFGRPAAEMVGGGWAQIVLPEDLERHTKTFFDAFHSRIGFQCETRVMDKTGQVRWLRCEGVPRFDDARRFLGYTGCNVDITESKVAEERRDLLINELNHRVKNTLATVQSIASQTLRNAPTTQEAKRALEERLIALSRAHDVLTRENWEGAELREIVAQAVEPYSSRGEDRLHLSGPRVRLSLRMALALAMALQELATNAVKYGALSNATGGIGISWSVDDGTDPARLHLRWSETGGPPVKAPTRRGFGSRLIERSLADDLAGQVQIAFATTGITCTVDAPICESALKL